MSAYPPIDDTAHCRLPGVDPERFHPRKSENQHQVRTTKAMCNGGGKVPACPFRDKCREYGITHNVSGIWGGFGEDERKAERKARRIVPDPLLFSTSLPITRTTTDEYTHGTWGGVRRHERAHQPVCDACRAFRNAHRKAKRDAARGVREDDWALQECDRCGKRMRPTSLARHRRNMHSAPAEKAS